ncbi:MAG: hypothetical protein K2X27_28465 [Candidatus Obscuribacterales bacterium]|nr:hypothetical protein [Candidatus Obscuribacterales bacterium]
MQALLKSLFLGTMSLLIASPVLAENGSGIPSNAGGGSYKIDDSLPRVKPYNARRQIEILNEGPIIKNRMQAEQAPDTYEIYLPPAGTIPGKHYVIGTPDNGSGTAFSSSNPNLNSNLLAPASSMHQSNIPYRSNTNPNLPPGQNTGIHSNPAAALAQSNARKAVSGSMQPKPKKQPETVAGYKNYKDSGSSNSGIQVKTEVSGTLNSPLKNRLFKK